MTYTHKPTRRTITNRYTVCLSDMEADGYDPQELCDIAIAEAEARTRKYCMPATWTARRASFGVYKVTRTHYA